MAPTNTRGPELGDSQPGRVGTRGGGVVSPGSGHLLGVTRPQAPPAPLTALCPRGPQGNFPWKSWMGTFKLCPFPLLSRLSPRRAPRSLREDSCLCPSSQSFLGPLRDGDWLPGWPALLKDTPTSSTYPNLKSSFTCLPNLGVLGVCKTTTRPTWGEAPLFHWSLESRVCLMGCSPHH